MKYNNKALKEARNLIAYAKQKTAGFKVNMSGLLVGYQYKDTPYAANMLLHQELEGKNLGIQVYFEPTRKNKCWRNAVLKMIKYPKSRPIWQCDYLVGGTFHNKSPLVIIPLRTISIAIGGNLPYTVLQIEEFTPLKYYSLPDKFEGN